MKVTGYRIAHFADLHLDAAFGWAAPDVARQRRQALQKTLRRILEVASEQKVDALFCGGDLFDHDRVSPDTEQFLVTAFADVHPLPVFLVPGNHDWYGTRSVYRRAKWTDNVHIFNESSLEPVTLCDGLTLWGAAHRSPAGTGNFLDDFRVDGSGIHVALFHGSERGGFPVHDTDKQPHSPFDAAQIEPCGVHHAFLGHYHRPKHADRHTYPGNPDPLTFGEDGARGLVIASVLPDGMVERETIDVASSAVHDITVDMTGRVSNEEILRSVCEELDGLEGAVRVTLQGELQPQVDLTLSDVERAAPWMEAVVARFGDVRDAYDFESIAEEPTVRGQFVADVLDAGLADADRRKVLVTGLRALEGRTDLEVQ